MSSGDPDFSKNWSHKGSPDIKEVFWAWWRWALRTQVTEMDHYWFQTTPCCLGRFLRVSWGPLWGRCCWWFQESTWSEVSSEGFKTSRLRRPTFSHSGHHLHFFPGKKKTKPPHRLSVLEPNCVVSVSVTHTQLRNPLYLKMEKLDLGKENKSRGWFQNPPKNKL